MTTSISAAQAIEPSVYPERKVLLEFSHPTVGNGDIADLVAKAMAEFYKNNRLASTEQEPFIASNGVKVRFHAPDMKMPE